MTPDQVFLKRKEDGIKIIYIVTKPSNDGTFEKGDHIYFTGDGMIGCIEASGFIDIEFIEEATKGMEYEIDRDWIDTAIIKYQNDIERLQHKIELLREKLKNA